MNRVVQLLRRPVTGIVALAMLLSMVVGFGGSLILHQPTTAQAANTSNTCQLNSARGTIKHVIYIQFDNTHFTRDNPNVPSDLEQMPNLLNFIENNGVMISKQHTP